MLTLIREGFFDDDAKMTGVPIDDSMIASVTTVSAPFRGTGIVYDLGSRTGTTSAVQQPSVRTSPIFTTVHRPPVCALLPGWKFHDESGLHSWASDTRIYAT